MPTTIVGVSAPGAGRAVEIRQMYDAGNSTHAARGRGGYAYGDMQEQTSTLGFGAIQTNYRILRGQSSAWTIKGQAVQFKWRAWPVLVKPTVRFTHPTGVWAAEVLLSWDASPAGLGESGLIFGAGNIRQPRINLANTHASFGVINIGGVLNWISLHGNPLAREIVPLGNHGNLLGANVWNKVRIEIHSATYGAEAAVKVFINDSLQLTRVWGATNVYLPDLEATMAAFAPELIAADTNDLFFRDLTWFEGSDVNGL